MGRHKIYTDKDKKLHRIVKALQKVGHKKITVTWCDAMSHNRGWRVESDLYEWKRFYGGVGDIVKAIDRPFTTVRPTENGWYLVKWAVTDEAVKVWIFVSEHGVSWGKNHNDDPEAIEVDVTFPDQIQFYKL